MKKVDVIFPAYINATIGPTGTLRRLLKNKDYLKKRGYELEIFTYDYLVSGGKVEAVDFTKGLSSIPLWKNTVLLASIAGFSRKKFC